MKLSNISKFAVIYGCIGASLFACKDDKLLTTDFEETYIPKEVILNVSETLPIAVGMDTTLSYTVLPLDFPDRAVAFLTSNPAVATVSADGTVHGVSVGEATITCTLPVGFGPYSTVVVNVIPEIIKAQSIDLSIETDLGEEGKIYVTDEIQLGYKINPDNHTYDRVEWASSNESLATVDEKGLVKCLATGSVTIKAISTDRSGVSGSITLNIDKFVEVESVAINNAPEEICLIGGNVDLDVTYSPANGTKGSVEWVSSDESVVTVHRGVLSPTGFGSATIIATCTSTGQSTRFNVTVPYGWYVWDAKNAFTGISNATSWLSNNEKPNIEDGVWRVYFPDAATNTGKWRRDIKLNCSNSDLYQMCSPFPVFAMRTNVAKGGNNTLDARTGNPKCNDGIELPDGSRILYFDMTQNFVEWGATFDFNLFQIKIADIPNDRYNKDNAWYDIFWCRTFKTLEEAEAFGRADAEANPMK